MLSRNAKLPLDIPTGIQVHIESNSISLTNEHGIALKQSIRNELSLSILDNKIMFHTNNDTKFAKALSGTIKALITNMITGLTTGFTKKIVIIGVGYKAQINDSKLIMNLGYSHQIEYSIPYGVKITATSLTELSISGADKQLVGQVASEIRAFRPVEPYKGKGIRYYDEIVIIKETKKK